MIIGNIASSQFHQMRENYAKQTQTLMNNSNAIALSRLRRLRWMAFGEGTTLLALVCIAVPLKHLAGFPGVVSVMGPVHGAAFLLYFWMVLNAVSSDDWTPGEVARIAIAALVPFGALMSAGLLSRKASALSAPQPAQSAA